MTFRLALAALVCALTTPLVFAQQAPKPDATQTPAKAEAAPAQAKSGLQTGKADAARAQPIVTQVCAACHGADGNSPTPANPVLAGQHLEYTEKQLANFKSGARKSAIMTPLAAQLSAQDMKNLGAYFEAQKPKPRSAKNPGLVKVGQQIYRGGIIEKGVAACSSCHGPNGAGIPAQFPRAAGQFSDYTVAQLQAFRSGERANDPNRIMRVIAGKLSDNEMKAVAEYMAGLR